METNLKMVYWKGEKFWVGKLVDHPEVMSQGKTLKEPEENIIDAYKLLVLDEVPESVQSSRTPFPSPSSTVRRLIMIGPRFLSGKAPGGGDSG